MRRRYGYTIIKSCVNCLIRDYLTRITRYTPRVINRTQLNLKFKYAFNN